MDTYHHAKSIVLKLVKEGFIAYFAGGWVRDYVMKHPSEDIDIATNAAPHQIMDLFPNTILVGLSFGVVIVVIEGHQFEVATFRKDLEYIDGRHPVGIEKATPVEDAMRRDFTINGMFYDPLEEVIHDHVNGREDIRRGIIKTIGDPQQRFFEDRLRMIRAFRFSSRFSFTVENETQEAIRDNADKLFPAVAMERVWQEFNKMAAYPRFDQAILDMHRLNILEVIFPELKSVHMNDLKHYVSSFHDYPPDSPTILYLMALFPLTPLLNKIEIAKRIKASTQDIKWVEYVDAVDAKVQKEESLGQDLLPYEWVHLLAHPHALLTFQVLAAQHPAKSRDSFLRRYLDRRQELSKWIERIRENTPVVKAADLIKAGMSPGRVMGLLLKEAEKFSVNEKVDDSHTIIAYLQSLPLWSLSKE